MKCIVQRVRQAEVRVAGEVRGAIERGLVALLGIEREDQEADRTFMADKIAHLRIFEDDAGKLNRSVLDIRGDVLLVPNFTVAGSTAKGRRPSFDNAMRPQHAAEMFEALAHDLRTFGLSVPTGVFGADMQVALVNDGPVTLILASRQEPNPSA